MGCEQYQEMMVDALYGELGDELRRRFEEHVAECDACSSGLAGMRETLDLMAKRERRDPGDAYWDAYWERLNARMDAEGVTTRGAPQVDWWRKAMPSRAWTYRAVAAAAILVVGVFVGRTFFPAPVVENRPDADVSVATPALDATGEDRTREAPDQQIASQDQPAVLGAEDQAADRDQPTSSVNEPRRVEETGGSIRAASADDRAMNYIEKSQMLLIALVNNDPANDPDAYASGIVEQRRRSRALVAEAPAIKAGLDDPKQRRLRELVSDLEKILMQIANLESDEDLDAVEFIRSRVNDHDVLFKINLEQMRHEESGGTSEGTQGENLRRSL